VTADGESAAAVVVVVVVFERGICNTGPFLFLVQICMGHSSDSSL